FVYFHVLLVHYVPRPMILPPPPSTLFPYTTLFRSRLYGGTNTLFTITLARLGIEVTLAEDPDDPQSWADAVQPNTRAFYAETFGNPIADILDIPAVAEVAHNNQVPLIVDNTIATAAVARPLE